MGCAERHARNRGRKLRDCLRARPPLRALEGARPSPNIWGSPGTYEIENQAFDQDALVWEAIAALGGWDGSDVLDLGCGTGFHLTHFADAAASVIGVEPHHGLAAIARRRTRRTASVQVLEGLASELPLPSQSVDFVHARWAYFFGPGCEPGLAELDRVMRPGGLAVILDNDPTRSKFGAWFRSGFPTVSPADVEGFWASMGWSRVRVLTSWRFESREDLEAVVRIELPSTTAETALESWDRLDVDYAVNLWWRRF